MQQQGNTKFIYLQYRLDTVTRDVIYTKAFIIFKMALITTNKSSQK